ncbi:MAG: VOC family protein [Cypionkella sp.]
MKYSSLAHVAIRVADVDKSLAFYARIGMPEMFRVHRDTGALWLIYVRITDDQFLEVFPLAETPEAHDPMSNGLNHFCLAVENLEATVRELAALEIPLFMPMKEGVDRNLQAWIKDPDGNRIELMQMSPTNMQAEAIRKMSAPASA